MKTIRDIIKIICDGNDKTYLSVAYGHTRTIKNAYDRKAMLYAVSFSGAYVVFKKHGGYLAYYLYKSNGENLGTMYGAGLRSHLIPLGKAVECILGVKEKRIGMTNVNDSSAKEILDYIFVSRI
jgi:hypothetical protein